MTLTCRSSIYITAHTYLLLVLAALPTMSFTPHLGVFIILTVSGSSSPVCRSPAKAWTNER